MQIPWILNDGLIILLSIFIEGIPFLLIGSILSGIAHIYLKREKVAKLLQSHNILSYFGAILLGCIIPVCECGNIPFTKKLISKGVPVSVATTFLLSAPVCNPIVFFATLSAFPAEPKIAILRVALTIFIAVTIGYFLSFFDKGDIIKSTVLEELSAPETEVSITKAFSIAKSDFKSMITIFFIGALIATVIQLGIQRDFVLTLSETPFLSIIAMMGLAFIVSICSNVDSFFALSYAQVFPQYSIIAFLVLGPMLDIKSIPMMGMIYKARGVLFIGTVAVLLTYVSTYFLFIIE